MGAGRMDLNALKQKAVRLKRDIAIAYYKDHLFEFCRDVLGYGKITPYPHGEICELLATGKNRKLFLLPRGSFKSTVITVGYSLWKIVYNPAVRILINSEVHSNAVKFFQEIKGHMEHNDTFRSIYGVLGKKNSEYRWNDEELIVNTVPKVLKEPTLCCGGVDTPRVGLHFDVIINDDLHSQKNTRSKEAIDTVKEFYALNFSLLDPKGTTITVGTRWSDFDLYYHIMETEKELTDVYLKSAIEPDGKMFMPEVLSKEFLELMKATQTPYQFSTQYMNDPISDTNSPFRVGDARFYERVPQGLNICLTVDPAVSQNQDADKTAMVVAGVDSSNFLYILDYVNERLQPGAIIDHMFRLQDKWKCRLVGIEKGTFEKFLKFALNDEQRRRGKFLPLSELKGWTESSKKDRIMALEPRWRANSIYVKKEQHELLNDFLRYPRIAHDDLLDACSMQLEIQRMANPTRGRDPQYDALPSGEKKVWDDARKFWNHVQSEDEQITDDIMF